MSDSLEETLEQKSRKEFKSRLKRGLIIAGLCASFVGITIWDINKKVKPYLQNFGDFITINKKYPGRKEIIYKAYEDGKEELAIKQKNYQLNFEENNGDNEFDKIEIKLQADWGTEHIILYPKDYLNYPPFNRLGKQKIEEIRKEFKEYTPFEKIKKKIE